jgi:hypothetical protein
LSIKSRKLFAILVIAMMLMTLLPVTAFAASDNSVNKVPQVSKDDEFTDENTAPFLRIKEKNKGDFSSGDYFELSLTNAEWNKDADELQAAINSNASTNVNVTVDRISKKLLGITIGAPDANGSVIIVPMLTKITAEDEAKVTIDPRDSAVTGGTYVFAVASAGATITTIEKVNTFGGRYGKLAPIRIDETRIGALGYEAQTIKLKLPPKYSWAANGGAEAKINPKGGLAGSEKGALTVEPDNKRTLTFTFTPVGTPAGEGDNVEYRSARGSIFIEGLEIIADRDAPYGEVVVDVDGDKVTATDLVVAERSDYAVTAAVAEVKELVAGMWDQKTAKITIEETLADSLIDSREVSVILPEWVKIVDPDTEPDGNISLKTPSGKTGEIGSRQNELFIKVDKEDDEGSNNKIKYEFELKLSIEADKSGDIVAEIGGAGMEVQELVIAKAVAPITAEVAATDLKIGVQNQPAPDIIIAETAKARIDDQYEPWDEDFDKELTVTLPKGIQFASTPDVEVTEGNLEIGKPKVTGEDKRELVIPVASSSTKPSTIKISNVKLTLDRTVPEGEFKAKIGGDALVKNDDPDATIKTEVEFAKGYVVNFVFANVITPAPGETRATTTFTIGSTTYTVEENKVAVEKTMDVAPYIKDGRTYLPVRFVAEALGVTEDNILWDPVSRKVTIFKGDRIAQMTIDSTTLLVNGVELTMDVAPEITNGRTMLPVRWMTQALGATIAWDAETQTVTVTQ